MTRRKHALGRERLRPRRGQALVEFALVLPLFFGLLFGLIELSLIYGAAALSTTAVDQAAHEEAITDMRSATVDQTAVSTVLRVMHPYFVAHVVRIEVYQSDAQGRGPQSTTENVFDGAGTPLTQNWPIAARMSTASAPLYIGVRVTYQYHWITSFIGVTGATLTLEANAVAPALPLGG